MTQVIDLQDLYAAYCQCRRHKRRTVNAQHYEVALLDNLFNTLEALHNRSYSPSRSMRFVAQKPKAREIHAAHFRDRVVHHWLVPRLEDVYEPIFIHDVYSNRLNKGTHKACDRLQAFMQAVGCQGWYLQLDIRNFFNSIDRPILFQLLQHRLRKALGQGKLTAQEADTLRWLVHVLLRHDAAAHSVYRGNPDMLRCVPQHKQLGQAGEHKGLPIGNLTSQFFANVYLNELDQFVKHQLKCRHYLRYVDDFILLATSPELLLQWRGQIVDFLQQQLQLQLKELAQPKPVKSGADFLGYIVYPHYRLVRRRVVGNLRERLNAFQALHIQGSVKQGYHLALKTDALLQLRAVLASYWGHFQHANSTRLRGALFRHYPWLALLFDLTLQPRWQPSAQSIVGYKSQLWFFRRQYPRAELRVQRGTEQDKVCASSQAQAWEFGAGSSSFPSREAATAWVDTFSFPRAAWECGHGALRRESQCLYGTQRVQHCVPTQRVGTRGNDAVPQTVVHKDESWGLGTRVTDTHSAPDLAEPALWVTRVIIREQGHLKNGLKCRVATLLFIQPGVQLCPHTKK